MSAKFHIERSILGTVILIPFVYLLYLINLPWDTPRAATAYYSILAFLAVTITASAANKIRIDPSPSNNILFACTGYASIIFSGAAIFYILAGETAVIHSETSGVFLNLVALATTGILLLLYSVLDGMIKKENSIWEKRRTSLAIIFFLTSVFVIMIAVVRLPLDGSVFLIAGYLTGTIAVLAYIAAAILIFQRRKSSSVNDPIRLAISFMLFAAASFNHILILPAPSSQWIISISLMALALVAGNVSISYTFLLDIGLRDNLAYGVTIGTSILAAVPIILSHIVERAIGPHAIIEGGATIIIHIGGAFLAGLSAYALYKKSSTRLSLGLPAIVFLLMFWMVAEIAIALSHFSPVYGFLTETRVPYIVGGITSSIMLILAIRRILDPIKGAAREFRKLYVLGLVLAPIILLVGEYIRQYILILFGTYEVAIGSALMLGLSYLSLYALLTYILLLISASAGKWRFDLVGAALASIWVIVIILKANFGYATAGWWVAEGVMYTSTIALSVLILRSYITESKELENVGSIASMYSQILSDSIVDHQKSAIDLLTEMTMETQADETRLNSLAQILNEVSRANEHARYLQVLVSGDKFQEADLEPTDLMDSIIGAMNRSGIPDIARKFKDDEHPKAQLVRANSLLVDLFYYLFKGISKRIGQIELVGVGILEYEMHPVSHSEALFDILVKTDKINQRQDLVKRYFESDSVYVMEFAYSKRLVDLFGGGIEWHTGIASSECVLITLKITLPKMHA